MAIVDRPINFRVYYKSFHTHAKEKLQIYKATFVRNNKKIDELYTEINKNIDSYNSLGIKLDNYSEFKNNKYDEGKFYKVAKGAFINRKNNYELATDTYNLYKLATLQKEQSELIDKIEFQEKLVNIKVLEYNKYLKAYFWTVHNLMITKGYGYSLGKDTGWICVNRCKMVNARRKIDYAKTRENKKRILAEGGHIWNKEEYEWCKENGIEYNAEKSLIFRNEEFVYEIALLGCKVENGWKVRFETADYRGSEIRGKTNKELIDLCNGDINKICALPLDLKSKVTLCVTSNKTLYTKFIRNEGQKPSIDTKVNSKNR